MAQKTESVKAHHRTRQEYPEDRFDRIPRSGRVGAHRVTARPRYVWQYIIGGLLGFALLTTIGILGVQSLGGGGNLPLVGTATPSPEPQPKAEAVIDPTATVVVLNGTPTPNLAESVSALITERQWGQIVYSGSASEVDVELSAVFYMDSADEAAAEALAAELGGISSYQTDQYVDYGVRLVVLIGANYAGPGLEGGGEQTGGTAGPEQDAVIDPVTGYAIDPETGMLVDPETGQLIERATQ